MIKPQPTNTSIYDDQLCSLDYFKMRPFLLPHLGNKIIESKSVLFIMESHYVDPAFFEYQDDKDNLKLDAPELFYNINEKGLTSKFKEYLNTRQIIKDSESVD